MGKFNGKKVWAEESNDEAESIQQTSDGGYIVAGTSLSFNGDITGHHGSYANDDCWIVKLDKNGNIQWQKSLGGSSNDLARSIQQTSDGGYILAGGTESDDGDVSSNHGSDDAWIIKLDFIGNIQWQKNLGGRGSDEAEFIRQTNDGGYIVAGGTFSNDGDVSGNHGGEDYWIVKLNDKGNIQWQKCLGGSSDDFVGSILQTNDGGYILAGGIGVNNGDISGNCGSDGAWIVKLDDMSNIQWQKSIGGSSTDFHDGIQSIQQTLGGGYIAAGRISQNNRKVSSNHGGEDFWIIKFATKGNVK